VAEGEVTPESLYEKIASDLGYVTMSASVHDVIDRAYAAGREAGADGEQQRIYAEFKRCEAEDAESAGEADIVDRTWSQMMCIIRSPLWMATAFVGADKFGRADVQPGVARLDRAPIEGDDLDELHERSHRPFRRGSVKLRCTSYDEEAALAAVSTRYDELVQARGADA
jgi:hypothetical protein